MMAVELDKLVLERLRRRYGEDLRERKPWQAEDKAHVAKAAYSNGNGVAAPPSAPAPTSTSTVAAASPSALSDPAPSTLPVEVSGSGSGSGMVGSGSAFTAPTPLAAPTVASSAGTSSPTADVPPGEKAAAAPAPPPEVPPAAVRPPPAASAAPEAPVVAVAPAMQPPADLSMRDRALSPELLAAWEKEMAFTPAQYGVMTEFRRRSAEEGLSIPWSDNLLNDYRYCQVVTQHTRPTRGPPAPALLPLLSRLPLVPIPRRRATSRSN